MHELIFGSRVDRGLAHRFELRKAYIATVAAERESMAWLALRTQHGALQQRHGGASAAAALERCGGGVCWA